MSAAFPLPCPPKGRKSVLREGAGANVRLVAASKGAEGRDKAQAVSISAPKKAPERSEQEQRELDDKRAREREVDRQLCVRAQDGDKQALAEILRKYGPLLFRTVLLPRLGSEAAAQDALADTYMRVLERFHQFEWRGCGVYPWLRVIAMRIALDALRSKKRETLFEPADLTRAVDEAERDLHEGLDEQLCEKRDREVARKRLDEALGSINQRYAKAIRLRVLQEKTREEAAEILGVTVPTFDVVLHRALSSLRKAIRSQEEPA
jgi:RNA polymerase sigma factor (sigma-70 family)